MSPITVVLADDHALTRILIRSVLEGDGFVVVGEAADGPAAVELVHELRPDVCVLDLRMPGGDGPAAVAALKQSLPAVPCVVLTASPDPDELAEAVAAGAVGVLEKSGSLEHLASALKEVLGRARGATGREGA